MAYASIDDPAASSSEVPHGRKGYPAKGEACATGCYLKLKHRKSFTRPM